MQENPAPPQQHPEYYLCVPGSGPPSLLAAVTAERVDQEAQAEIPIANLEEQGHDPLPNDVASVYGTQPVGVFSPSSFVVMVRRMFCPYQSHSCVDHTSLRSKRHHRSGR